MSATAIDRHRGSYLMPSVEHAVVSEAMHPGILACEPDATLTEVARMMATYHVRAIAVMGMSHDEHGEKLTWRLISDRDLVRSAISDGGATSAVELASEPILTVEPNLPVRQAAELMLGAGCPHVVVIDPSRQRPIGVLSMFDIVGLVAWGEA